MDKKKLALFIMVITCTLSTSFANQNFIVDSCKILKINSKSILIGNRKAEVGLWFDDKLDTIVWTNDEEAIKVQYKNEKPTYIYADEFIHKNRKWTLYTMVHASTKDSSNDFDDGTISTQYLLDTLSVPRWRDYGRHIDAEVLIYPEGDDTISKTIQISTDKRNYLIPREIFDKKTKSNITVDIIETDLERDWKYAVWRKLSIKLLPNID